MNPLSGILFLYIVKICVSFEGLFWHISDIHLNITYDYNNNQYGDYFSDASYPLVRSALDTMKSIKPDVKFIIWNGDNAYHRIRNRNNFLLSIKNVSEEIRLQFPNMNILPTLGNHDVNPSSRFDINSKWCEELFEVWKKFFTNTSKSEIATFKKGCYYSRHITSKNETLKIIALNSMLWYKPNRLISDSGDPLDQFLWLKNELDDAKEKRFKVFIISHIPPGASEYAPKWFRFFHTNFNERFLKILQNYSDVIDGGFFGHQHIDAFKIVYNSQNKPIIPLFLSPSVSPFYLRGLGSINPSLRLFSWNGTNSKSRYYQFHTSIPNSPNNTKSNILTWSLEYISTNMLPGLSAADLHNLTLDLSQPNSTYFDKFFKHHLSGRVHDIQQCQPSSSCRCQIVCGMQNIDYTNLDICLRKCPFDISVVWIIISMIILSVTLVFICSLIVKVVIYNRKKRNSELSYRFTIEKS